MSEPNTRRRFSLRRDEGSVAVEAALIFPVLVVLLFGIIEFSMVLRDHVSLTAAARSGARTASAMPRVAGFDTNAAAAVVRAGTGMPMSSVQELWIYEAGANGYPTGTSNFNSCGTRCEKFRYQNGAFTKISGTWNYSDINACAGDNGMTAVGIYIKANHTFASGLFGSGISIADHAVMRFEPMPLSAANNGVCKP